MAVGACLFDAYGTLFDVHSAVRGHAARVGANAESLSAVWRTKQLEYAWVRSLMNAYVDFWRCTADALDFALSQYGLAHDGELRELLLQAYRTLSVYPETRRVLQQLRSAGIRTAVLSNGSLQMLQAAVRSAGLDDLDLPLLSVDSLGVYKPAARVYQSAVDALGIDRAEISFQSSNAWDIAGARAFGFRTVWINRARQPDEYGLRGDVPELPSLDDLIRQIG